ncbi:MAG: Dabb family protein [Parcubacteria group bacterium]|nr:Dabb family protein [Parcubacteria group bacterium]
MKALWHVVLISFRPETPESVRMEIYKCYQTLGEDCGGMNAGILFMLVEHNLDLRKNIHLVEIALFKDSDALQTFRQHPKHKELVDILSKVADWQIGDIYQPCQIKTVSDTHRLFDLGGR